MTTKLIAGIDIGGTNVRCAIASVEDPGAMIVHRCVGTPDVVGPEPLVAFIEELVQACARDAGGDARALERVGCALPGMVDTEAGVVRAVSNLRGWQNVPLRRMLEDRFGTIAVIENDVNAAALGEYRYGAGQGRRSLAYMTVSTGVAAGLVLEGQVWRGHHVAAGEIAYMLPEPRHIGGDWEDIGCLELLSAGVGLGRAWAKQRGGPAVPSRAVEVFEAAEQGDADAEALIRQSADYLALAAVALCSVIDPEVLVLGGSIAQHQARIAGRIREVVEGTLLFPPEVRPASLEGDAPLIGALSLGA